MSNYKEYYKEQIELMPQYKRNQLLAQITRFGDELLLFPENTDVKEKLFSIVDNQYKEFLQGFERLYLNSDYKYSALYEVNNTDLENLTKNFQEQVQENYYIEYANSLSEIKPRQFDEDSYLFSFLLEGTKLEENRAVTKKTTYSVLVTLFELEESLFLEIDVENVAAFFRNNKLTFFTDIIARIISWIEDTLLIDLTPINLSSVINDFRIEDNSSDFPQVSAQKMILASGSQATLDSASSEAVILPILGELDNLIKENDKLFSENTEVKTLLNDFISNIQNEADLPWISFMWDNEVKSRRVQVKFMMNIGFDQDYTLLNFYSHRRGRDGMNHAIRTLLEKYNEIRNI